MSRWLKHDLFRKTFGYLKKNGLRGESELGFNSISNSEEFKELEYFYAWKLLECVAQKMSNIFNLFLFVNKENFCVGYMRDLILPKCSVIAKRRKIMR